ncbi:hypothetical protein MLD38_025960 [Melastoma candidum]|uniref:Uncharacterized protein n=1 Tax=Melastoma candidum TaxID=119954 RepID=A0ACB9P083_9MYRT|nr:hypothetical protein MLD38_025960 [Melastoma candidum]
MTLHVSNPNAAIHGPRGEHALVVLVPIAGKDLVVMGRHDLHGIWVADIPYEDSTIPGGEGDYISVARVPDDRVNATGLLEEGAEGLGAVKCP